MLRHHLSAILLTRTTCHCISRHTCQSPIPLPSIHWSILDSLHSSLGSQPFLHRLSSSSSSSTEEHATKRDFGHRSPRKKWKQGMNEQRTTERDQHREEEGRVRQVWTDNKFVGLVVFIGLVIVARFGGSSNYLRERYEKREEKEKKKLKQKDSGTTSEATKSTNENGSTTASAVEPFTPSNYSLLPYHMNPPTTSVNLLTDLTRDEVASHPLMLTIGRYGLPQLPFQPSNTHTTSNESNTTTADTTHTTTAATVPFHLLPPIFLRHGFAYSYNTKTRTADWTIERLIRQPSHPSAISNTTSTTTGTTTATVSRDHCSFGSDSLITPGFQSHTSDYRGRGFDRGHLTPAADITHTCTPHTPTTTTSVEHQRAICETFVLSNIAPQLPQFNRGYWSQLENHCRQLAQTYGEVFAVTGPLWIPTATPAPITITNTDDNRTPSRNVTANDSNSATPSTSSSSRPSSPTFTRHLYVPILGTPPHSYVHVPTHFFKVILVIPDQHTSTTTLTSSSTPTTPRPMLASFIVPNTNIPLSTPLTEFSVPLEQVELYAGWHLFPKLHRSIKGGNGKRSKSPYNSNQFIRTNDLCSIGGCDLKMKEFNPHPKASRLVGIEPNPGPNSNDPDADSIITISGPTTPSIPIIQLSASNLFADGLHIIYSYLTDQQFFHILHVCRNWSHCASTGPSRQMEYYSLWHCSSKNDSHHISLGSRLNYHFTRFEPKLGARFNLNEFASIIRLLPHLTTIDFTIGEDSIDLSHMETIEWPHRLSSLRCYFMVRDYPVLFRTIFQLASLTSLSLMGVGPTCQGFTPAESFRSLIHLSTLFVLPEYQTDPFQFTSAPAIYFPPTLTDLTLSPLNHFLRHLGHMENLHQVRKLDFILNQELEPNDLRMIHSHIPRIEQLNGVRFRSSDGNDIPLLDRLHSFTLDYLRDEKSYNSPILIHSFIDVLSQLPRLTHLHLKHASIFSTDDYWTHAYRVLPRITSIELNIGAYTSPSTPFKQLGLFADRLKRLTITGLANTIRPTELILLSTLTELEYLSLSRSEQHSESDLLPQIWIDQVKSFFDSSDHLPNLLELHLIGKRVLRDHPHASVKFVWDQPKSINRWTYRLKSSNIFVANPTNDSSSTPLRARLVGVELNPGPSSIKHSHATDLVITPTLIELGSPPPPPPMTLLYSDLVQAIASFLPLNEVYHWYLVSTHFNGMIIRLKSLKLTLPLGGRSTGMAIARPNASRIEFQSSIEKLKNSCFLQQHIQHIVMKSFFESISPNDLLVVLNAFKQLISVKMSIRHWEWNPTSTSTDTHHLTNNMVSLPNQLSITKLDLLIQNEGDFFLLFHQLPNLTSCNIELTFNGTARFYTQLIHVIRQIGSKLTYLRLRPNNHKEDREILLELFREPHPFQSLHEFCFSDELNEWHIPIYSTIPSLTHFHSTKVTCSQLNFMQQCHLQILRLDCGDLWINPSDLIESINHGGHQLIELELIHILFSTAALTHLLNYDEGGGGYLQQLRVLKLVLPRVTSLSPFVNLSRTIESVYFFSNLFNQSMLEQPDMLAKELTYFTSLRHLPFNSFIVRNFQLVDTDGVRKMAQQFGPRRNSFGEREFGPVADDQFTTSWVDGLHQSMTPKTFYDCE